MVAVHVVLAARLSALRAGAVGSDFDAATHELAAEAGVVEDAVPGKLILRQGDIVYAH